VPHIALHTVLKPGCEDEYERVHRHIPDEVADLLREHGVREWRIWRDGTHVFHLVDVDDYQAMRRALAHHPANLAWQRTVAPFFEVADSYAGSDHGIDFLWSLGDQLGEENH